MNADLLVWCLEIATCYLTDLDMIINVDMKTSRSNNIMVYGYKMDFTDAYVSFLSKNPRIMNNLLIIINSSKTGYDAYAVPRPLVRF